MTELPELSDWEKVYNWIPELLGRQVPSFVGLLLGVLFLVALILGVISLIVIASGKIIETFKGQIQPLFYDANRARAAQRRRIFAGHLVNELRTKNRAENWRDDEFAELEAEVEGEGARTRLFQLPWRQNDGRGIWRETSLTRALQRSTERLILLEGDPGSGKSVALRHVALNLAEMGAKARKTNSLLPVYVNFKELKRPEHSPVDRKLINDFIVDSLNRVNDSAVTRYLDEYFQQGIEDGTWLFLFDSFDEIPDILSSTEVDSRISEYSAAINDFMGSFNSCRGIVASRFYRGPSNAGWKRFRILELSEQRQLRLIRRANLSANLTQQLIGEIATAPREIKNLARNPMLLGLLCAHMDSTATFPSTSHEIFEEYFLSRLARDETRLQTKFGLFVGEVMHGAQSVAFALAVNERLGLSPTRADLKAALSGSGELTRKLDTILDALEYMRFGRADRDASGDTRQFTFAHRRFQEYFATTVVIKNPNIVPRRQLLTDARWRETAVALLQLGSVTEIYPVLEEAFSILCEARPQFLMNQPQEQHSSFEWPPGSFHVLSLLQSGLQNKATYIPPKLTDLVTELLSEASRSGRLDDKKLALEIAGLAHEHALLDMIRDALTKDSQWLNDTIFQQISRLSVLPPDIGDWIRASIARMTVHKQLPRDRAEISAYILRLRRPQPFLHLINIACYLRAIDTVGSLVCATTLSALVAAAFGAWGVALVPTTLLSVVVLFRLFWTSGMLSTTSRVVLLLLLIEVGAGIARLYFHHHAVFWIWLASLYIATWSPFVIINIRRGVLVSYALLPFSQVSMLLVIRDILNFRLLKAVALQILLLVLAGSCFLIGELYLSERWRTVARDGFFGVMIVTNGWLLLRITVAAANGLLMLIRDSRTVRDFRREISHRTFEEFAECYGTLQTHVWKFRLLKHFRESSERSLLLAEERAMLQMIEDVEVDSPNLKSGAQESARFIRMLTKEWRPDLSGVFGIRAPELRDELYKLLEHSRRRRL